MNALALKRDAPRERIPSRRNWTAFDKFSKLLRKSTTSPETICFAFTRMDERTIGLTQPCGRLDEGVQHRLQIERRPADDLEHIGGGGLLLQRFGKVIRALTQRVDQAHVVNCDDGLIGKCPEERDLCFCEL